MMCEGPIKPWRVKLLTADVSDYGVLGYDVLKPSDSS